MILVNIKPTVLLIVSMIILSYPAQSKNNSGIEYLHFKQNITPIQWSNNSTTDDSTNDNTMSEKKTPYKYKSSGAHNSALKTNKKYNWQKYQIKRYRANHDLLHAINTRRPGMAIACFKAGANPNHKNSLDIPLFALAATDQYDMVVIFLRYGVNINIASSRGTTALINAAWNKRIDIIDLLINNKANVNQQCILGRNALMNAVMKCHVDGVRFLWKQGTNPKHKDKKGRDAADYFKAYARCKNPFTARKMMKLLRSMGLKL